MILMIIIMLVETVCREGSHPDMTAELVRPEHFRYDLMSRLIA
jgi:hypothetical protein